MNLNEILNTFNLLIGDKLPNREDLTPERFEELLKVASLSHFEKEVDREHWGNLRPFRVSMGDDYTQPLVIDSDGHADIPTGFRKAISMIYKYQDGSKIREKVCRIVDDELYDELTASATEYPTLNYPICNIQDGYFRFRPRNLRYMSFVYVKYPTDPHFAYTIDRGFVEYDPDNSVELEWDENNQISVIETMVKSLGMSVSRQEVEQAAEQTKQNTK